MMKHPLRLISILFLAVLLLACEGDTIPFNVPPTLTVSEATDIYRKGATISGTYTKANDKVGVETFGLYYATNSLLGDADSILATPEELQAGNYTITLNNLTPATTYYYATFASSGFSIAKSETKSFITSSEATTVLSTISAYTTDETDVLFVSASVLDEGLSTISDFGFVYSTDTQTPTVEANRSIHATGNKDSFISKLTELIPNLTNYIRAYSYSNEEGYVYGETFIYNVMDFPYLTTLEATNVMPYFADLHAELDGKNSQINESGFLWSESNKFPSFEDNKLILSSGSKLNGNITGLKDNTIYYYRPFANHAKGVSYGAVKQFRTLLVQQAELSSTTVSDISYKVATFTASVTTMNNGTITDTGFVYATTDDPTLADSHLYTGNDTILSAVCRSLQSGTTYYVRAYATNEKGTAYGPVSTFNTKSEKYNIERDTYDDDIKIE